MNKCALYRADERQMLLNVADSQQAYNLRESLSQIYGNTELENKIQYARNKQANARKKAHRDYFIWLKFKAR